MTVNPYQPTSLSEPHKQAFSEHATCTGSTFLFRTLKVTQPIECAIRYSGWWFIQSVEVDGVRVWSKVSWLTILRNVTFPIPAKFSKGQHQGKPATSNAVQASAANGQIEIEFGRGLQIRRFRLWIDGDLVYDEIN